MANISKLIGARKLPLPVKTKRNIIRWLIRGLTLAIILSHLTVAVNAGPVGPESHLEVRGKKPKEPKDDTPQWQGCGKLDGHTLECVSIPVPMNHDDPNPGKNFTIPLIRLLGKDNSQRRAVIVSAGTPGESGIDFLKKGGGYLNTIIGENFDLLAFDPRGVKSSIPKASCYRDDDDRPGWNSSAVEDESRFAKAQALADDCIDIVGEHGAYINTPQVADDLNVILGFVNQEDLMFWGFDYGTILGQTYAQMFPEHVDRMVLDGVMDLDEYYNAFHAQSPLLDVDKAFAGFIKKCFLAKDLCPLMSIPGGPFDTAADLGTYINGFLSRFEETSIAVFLEDRYYGQLTREIIFYHGVLPCLYSIDLWLDLAKDMADLMSGNPLPAYSHFLKNPWVHTDEAGLFLTMNDNWKTGVNAPYHDAASIHKYLKDMPERSLIVDPYTKLDSYNIATWGLETTHLFRPQYHPQNPVNTARPILFIGVTTDPVTPFKSAKRAYYSFQDSALIEQNSFGHTSLSSVSTCTAKHVRRYFKFGQTPEPDTVCDAEGIYFPPPPWLQVHSKRDVSGNGTELVEALEGLKGLIAGQRRIQF